jgi:HSP20 family protein
MTRGPFSLSRSGRFGGSDFDNPLLAPFATLYRDMQRLFGDGPGGAALGAPTGGMRHGSGALSTLVPQIDVSETDRELRIVADLPGANESDIEVSMNGDLLTIRAVRQMEREEERENFHVSERVFGTFQRTLQLPFPADPNQVQARFDNGVLTITIPKTQTQESSRRIPVQGGGADPNRAGGDQNPEGGETQH